MFASTGNHTHDKLKLNFRTCESIALFRNISYISVVYYHAQRRHTRYPTTISINLYSNYQSTSCLVRESASTYLKLAANLKPSLGIEIICSLRMGFTRISKRNLCERVREEKNERKKFIYIYNKWNYAIVRPTRKESEIDHERRRLNVI